jgi:phage terminase large subunit-like protein
LTTAPDWTTACPDWQERILAGKSLIPCPPLFAGEADKAMRLFRGLRLVDLPGQPTIGAVSRPWLLDFAGAVFGSYDPESGRRLIRYFLLSIAKKNSKSTLAAGLLITLLMRNWRAQAEFLILAPTIEVAGNSFAPARGMVRASAKLTEFLRVQDHLRTITHRENGATAKIVAADDQTVGGKKASVVVDELWLFGKKAGAENMLREATGGLAARPEGCVIYLTTQSDEAPAGVFAQELEDFRAVRDGKVTDRRRLGVIYEYPPALLAGEGWKDPKTWRIPNPNLGASVDEEFLLDQFRRAERNGTASLRGFAAKHLNVQVDLALRADGWVGAEYWQQGIEPGLTFAAILDRAEVVTIGIDGGGLDDLLGVYGIGREPGGTALERRRWLGWARAFVSPEGERRRKINAENYAQFVDDGELVRTPLLEDLDAVVAIVREVRETGLLDKVGVDAMGLGLLVDALDAIGVTEDSGELIAVRQGIGLMGSIKTVERKLADGSFRHCGGRLMNWCVSNLVVVPTPTAIRLARDETGRGKIDPAAAMFDVAALMSGPRNGLLKASPASGRFARSSISTRTPIGKPGNGPGCDA